MKYTIQFNEGQRRKPLVLEPDLLPNEKGEARKSYERGRVVGLTDDLRHCLRYMRLADMKRLSERLEALYRQTLVDMYGEEEADKILSL